MRDWLLARGVPEEEVITHTGGVNTQATAMEVVRLQQEEGVGSVLLVSQFFHLSRARVTTERAGGRDVGTVHAEVDPTHLPYLARDTAGFHVYLFRY